MQVKLIEIELAKGLFLAINGNEAAVIDYSFSPPKVGTTHQFDVEGISKEILVQSAAYNEAIFLYNGKKTKAIISGNSISFDFPNYTVKKYENT